MTLFSDDHLIKELKINGEKDALLVFRDDGSKQEVALHLPPFQEEAKEIPTHVCVAIAIAACIYNGDTDFQKLISDKLDKYGEEYLSMMSIH